MYGDDLFPRDFIISLDPPSNYFSSERIFSSEADLDIVRMVKDHEEYFPTNHKLNWRPKDLPASLREAIQVFILSRAIRLLRGEAKSHNSMMINVSRFTMVQSHIKLLVDEYIKEIRQSVLNHYKLRSSEALKNSVMADLKGVFTKEFPSVGYTWAETQKILKESISPIDVIEVNSSSAAEKLDYSIQNYPQGRNLIAIGGLSLSRGLTLEGLTVSYFLRNSIMYDTLMQMGRWFGYRDEYEDLCRIYMTADAFSWYAYISDATEELRKEFKRMKAADMTPKDFGLCVRSHPDSLIVTARNKMRTGKLVTRKVSLDGRLVETSILLKTPDVVSQNLGAMEALVLEAKRIGRKIDSEFGYLWTDVPVYHILQFIDHFYNHPASQITEKIPIKNYISQIHSQAETGWDLVLVSLQSDTSGTLTRIIGGLNVNSQLRTVSDYPKKGGNGIVLNKRRVASRGIEKAGLSDDDVQKAKADHKEKNIPDRVYRKHRTRPLLMLHLLDCKSADDERLFENGILAYGISFPGEAGSKRPEKLVEYVVNTIWWKNEYLDLLDEEEIEDDQSLE